MNEVKIHAWLQGWTEKKGVWTPVIKWDKSQVVANVNCIPVVILDVATHEKLVKAQEGVQK